MKSIYSFITVFLLSLLLISCGKHSDGTSVWAEGLFIVPLLPFVMSVIFGVLGYIGWTSGSKQQFKDGTRYYKENVPFWKVNYFLYSALLLLATIVIIVVVNLEK